MKTILSRKLIACVLLGLYPVLGSAAALAQSCSSQSGVSIQVLGSGGPIADDGRASSGYLVWRDGKARVLVDLGGGAILRFAQSGASFSDLDAIVLTHLHADHSAGLPALLKSGYFANRSRSLALAGPAAGGNKNVHFPSLDEYLASMLQTGSGAYQYLDGYLSGKGGMPLLKLTTVANDLGERAAVEVEGARGGIYIEAMAVSHGPVPALAYRIEVDDRVVVFAGDQDGRTDAFVDFAQAADLLVLHMPIPETAGSGARALHAPPSSLGEIAAEAKAKRVLLSHFMARSLADLPGNAALVESVFAAQVDVAEDLSCFSLD
ncbi:MBL fold metallo-hydrolase [Congregibacter variabilis]|uniref:MBL fold metallo-hydrolase n=1 Tax=Congregibacter variabilis TaxID=3081200 RepID=A0ABZ0I8M3_9GAMM|nr:MBL fold metallo-hydrolase [Congregibacter sp. IMCC43200]